MLNSIYTKKETEIKKIEEEKKRQNLEKYCTI